MVEASSNAVPAQAQATKDEALAQAGDLKNTALEHVGALTEDAKNKATNVAHDVRRELETQGDAQAKRAASALRSVGSQLHDMADSGQSGTVTDVTRQLADKSRQVASRLEEGGVQGASEDLRRFARRQPGVFLAAAGLAGFVVTRALRSAQGNTGPTSQSTAPFTSTQPTSPEIGLATGAPAVPEMLP